MSYAAAISLLNTLNSLLGSNHEFSNAPNHLKSQIESLRDGVLSLKNFLDNNTEIKSDFEAQLRDAIYEAEDIIDSHILESEISQQSFDREIDLETTIQKINSIVELTKEKFNHLTLDRQIRCLSWRKGFDCSKKKYPFIGRREDLNQLRDRLMTGSLVLQVVPIVGVRGMGKTALARHVFEDPSISEHFGITCWFKVPIKYRKRDVLLGLLESMKKRGDEIRQMTDDQLAKHVYNALKNKKYLLVLDDIRDVTVWNDLKEIFPDHYKGSRIMLTTREIDAAPAPPHQLDRLIDEDTLALLGNVAFDDEPCPPELAIIAKDIAQSCRGLPLAAVIVGRLLACAEMSAEYWEIVVSSIKTSQNYSDLVEAVVSLTYKHLPQHLKSSLFYMATLPYDNEVSVFKLMRLFVAEGFILRSSTPDSLEMDALNTLGELQERGLICFHIVDLEAKLRINEEVFQEFIVRKAEEEKFFYVVNGDTNDDILEKNDTYNQQRRLCIQKNIHHFIKDLSTCNSNALVSNVRSLLYMGPADQYPMRSWLDFKLLKVLNALKIHFYTFPPEVLKLLQLTYLALSYNGELPTAVCKLRKLKALIVLRYLCVKRFGTPSYLPEEIWNMEELRYLKVIGSDLPDFSSDTNLVHANLLILSNVGARSCTPQALERFTKLWKLGIRFESALEDESSLSFFSHLEILKKLHRFKCVVMYPDMGSHQVVPSSIPAFPYGLRKLTLSGCGFPWEYMSVIAALSHLEVLKLRSYAFRGPNWEVKEGEFPMLYYLLLEDMDLENWILADGSFAELENLVIKHCYKLQEVPPEFADITILKTIEVEDCSPSVMCSAQQIDKNRKDSKLDRIQVDVYSSLDD